MSDIFRIMANDLKRAVAGKIAWYSAGYKFGDQPYTNPGGYTWKPFLDLNGRMVVLTPGRYVSCPSPPTEAPKLEGRYSVKMGACMKCQHHLPGMCCALLREKGKSAPAEMRKTIADTVAMANEIVKS